MPNHIPQSGIKWFKFNVSLFHKSRCPLECFMPVVVVVVVSIYWLLLHPDKKMIAYEQQRHHFECCCSLPFILWKQTHIRMIRAYFMTKLHWIWLVFILKPCNIKHPSRPRVPLVIALFSVQFDLLHYSQSSLTQEYQSSLTSLPLFGRAHQVNTSLNR